MNQSSIITIILASFLTISACGGSTSHTGTCAAGAEQCACNANGTCNQGLECRNDVCAATNTGSGGSSSPGAGGSRAGTGGNHVFVDTSTGGAIATGGANATGGARATGGSTATGGTTGTGGAGSTVIVCAPTAETPGSCGECLQLAVPGGMCDQYKPCAAQSGCTALINAMANCMASKAMANGGDVPTGADSQCRASTAGMSTADTSPSALAARTLWNQISTGICGMPCWAV